MANEGQARFSIYIKKGSDPVQIEYSPRPTAFNFDVAGAKGPVPGAFTAEFPGGTDVDFSELTQPGMCRIANLDSTNFVTWGAYDPENQLFFPIGEILPGEFYPIRLSRLLAWEFGTGAGTVGPETNRLRIRPSVADCEVLVEAFEV